jgi:hypothetical protein
MANIRTIDMEVLEELFGMEGGFVLEFSNRTFANFFEELDIDIYSPVYSDNGESKAKRLRCFLQKSDKSTIVRTLRSLWEYREVLIRRSGEEDSVKNAHALFLSIIDRIEGRTSLKVHDSQQPVLIDKNKIAEIKRNLISMSNLAPAPRGYAFEKFLKDLFDIHGLAANDPFRIKGEQIDGSFQFADQTYLVEAKWQGQLIGAAELHTFHGKIEQKAAWTRGLFVSNSGFTEDGLIAFGRGKKIICMDGLDLYEMLDREIPFSSVIEKKARKAAETGSVFVRVRDLFP